MKSMQKQIKQLISNNKVRFCRTYPLSMKIRQIEGRTSQLFICMPSHPSSANLWFDLLVVKRDRTENNTIIIVWANCESPPI